MRTPKANMPRTQHVGPGCHPDHSTIRLTITTLCCAVVKLGVESSLGLLAWELAALLYNAIPAAVKS